MMCVHNDNSQKAIILRASSPVSHASDGLEALMPPFADSKYAWTVVGELPLCANGPSEPLECRLYVVSDENCDT